MNYAIDDVSKLLDHMSKVKSGEVSISTALSLYEKEVVKRGQEAVDMAFKDQEFNTRIHGEQHLFKEGIDLRPKRTEHYLKHT